MVRVVFMSMLYNEKAGGSWKSVTGNKHDIGLFWKLRWPSG